MALFPVTTNYPKSPNFNILYRLSCVRGGWRYRLNLVHRLTVASASPWMANHP